jgi:hypothetical protein
MKEYIPVLAHFDTEGQITPVAFWWKEKEYSVDRIFNVQRRASIIGGGIGIRYTCRILSKERYLYFDDYESRWFVEYEDKLSLLFRFE